MNPAPSAKQDLPIPAPSLGFIGPGLLGSALAEELAFATALGLDAEKALAVLHGFQVNQS